MDSTLPPPWRLALSRLDYAFQPIALYSDGSVYGFEALLRGWEVAGFGSIAEVFDLAFSANLLYAIDLELRRKAFAKFAASGMDKAKIFYNLDNRLLQMPDYSTGNTLRIAEETGLAPTRIVLELSELHEPSDSGFDRIISSYRNQGFRIALDDFGSGYAGLKLLDRAEPDIVKIDRYFVDGLGEDPRKSAFLGKIAAMAHLMGISVIAEGVETAQELRLCADSGCDMVQGFHIARPSLDFGSLRPSYDEALAAGLQRRTARQAGKVGLADVVEVSPVALGAGISEVLSRFAKDPGAIFIPVVNSEGEPVGVYRERDFRQYVYSPYGISLLEHLTSDPGHPALLIRAPSAPVDSDLAKVVELYGSSPECGGVVLTESGRYVGILPAESVLSLVAERELAEARDQNPLSRLPGNLRIGEICAQKLNEPGEGTAYAYFDFDNFKPFNDLYGFRNGDRVIMLFADILKALAWDGRTFVGHLGGDDFFACLDATDLGASLDGLRTAAIQFAREAESFYSPEDRDRGWILGKDRAGKQRRMPLLTVSLAVVVQLPGADLNAESLAEVLAGLKREAKLAPDHLAARIYPPGAGELEGEGSDSRLSPARGRGSNASGLRQQGRPVFTPSFIAAY
jgi:EAL domain-containing protein (putative c-di-GMP-specific phosphodiesterase class I)/GGDEF domain-containing protein/CBS domain-containing protein